MKKTYYGDILETGELKLAPWVKSDMANQFKAMKPGTHVKITVQEDKDTRSIQQNKYYWGVVLPTIADHIGTSTESLHEDMKIMFNPIKSETVKLESVYPFMRTFLKSIYKIMSFQICGKTLAELKFMERIIKKQTVTLGGSTAKLNTQEFWEYVERVCKWAAEYLELVISEPGFNDKK